MQSAPGPGPQAPMSPALSLAQTRWPTHATFQVPTAHWLRLLQSSVVGQTPVCPLPLPCRVMLVFLGLPSALSFYLPTLVLQPIVTQMRTSFAQLSPLLTSRQSLHFIWFHICSELTHRCTRGARTSVETDDSMGPLRALSLAHSTGWEQGEGSE